MTFKTDDRVFETSITTGTGTYTLDGAQVGFTTFAGMGNGNDCPYFATDDTNWEVGIGNILTGPNRLARSTILRSSNADAAVDWGAGTRKLRCGWPAAMALPRVLSKSVAGNSDVALTQDEQRRDIIILTGALTGNINVTVDTSVWAWPMVYNNTTGNYTVTFKTTAGTGLVVPQGQRMTLVCDGTNVTAPGPTTFIGNSVTANVAGSVTATTFTDTGASIALPAGTYIISSVGALSLAGGAVGTGIDYRTARLGLTDAANNSQFYIYNGHCNSEQTHDHAMCVLAQPLVVAAPTTYKTRFTSIQNSGANTTITGLTLLASADYPHTIIATKIG